MLLSIYAYANIIKFDSQGIVYNIEEENGNSLIQKRIKDLNITKLTNIYKANIEKAYYGDVSIADSIFNFINTEEDYTLAAFDIKDIFGNILYKKNDKIASILPNKITLDLCFINGNFSNKIINHIIDDFGKECIYLVSKVDIRTFKKTYRIEEVYPLNTQNNSYVERFNIKYLPTKIHKFSKYITTKTLNIQEIQELYKYD
jgi:hypothetical protein